MSAKFSREIAQFIQVVNVRQRLIHSAVAGKLYESVVLGSNLTGSPGQPVDTGNLKTSFIGTFPEPLLWELTTNTVYAPSIEEGVGPRGRIKIRSSVGGTGSVKKTISGYRRIVKDVMEKL
jgi:hypothetical protein